MRGPWSSIPARCSPTIPAVPLVVPEVNAADVAGLHRRRRIVASPDTPAIRARRRTAPGPRAFRPVVRAVVSTFSNRCRAPDALGSRRGRGQDTGTDARAESGLWEGRRASPSRSRRAAGWASSWPAGLTRDEAVHCARRCAACWTRPDLSNQYQRGFACRPSIGTGMEVKASNWVRRCPAAAARDLLAWRPPGRTVRRHRECAIPDPRRCLANAVCLGRLRVDEDRATLDCWAGRR